jgi:hypothetical protein
VCDCLDYADGDGYVCEVCLPIYKDAMVRIAKLEERGDDLAALIRCERSPYGIFRETCSCEPCVFRRIWHKLRGRDRAPF